MVDRLPPLRLTAAERRYLASELDIAAEGYEDCIQQGDGTQNADARRDARRLRALAVRMRGGPQPGPEGTMVRLADLRG